MKSEKYLRYQKINKPKQIFEHFSCLVITEHFVARIWDHRFLKQIEKYKWFSCKSFCLETYINKL